MGRLTTGWVIKYAFIHKYKMYYLLKNKLALFVLYRIMFSDPLKIVSTPAIVVAQLQCDQKKIAKCL